MSFFFDETTKSFGYDSRKFEKFEIIGQGSYGKVKLAHYDGDMSKIFAIKKMLAKKGSKEEKISENEINILEKLSKFKNQLSFFPKYYGYTRKTEENKIKYNIFLEYFPYTLENLIETNDVSFEMIKSIVYQLIDGLAFLQTVGLCHRDIKPGNILYEEINNDIKIKIIDFGTSKENVTFSNQKMTITGTPCFFSPELFVKYHFEKGLELNPYKSDVFSLGLIIVQIITKKQQIFKSIEYDGKNEFFEDLKKQIYKKLENLKKKIDIEKENRENFFELIKSMLEIKFKYRPDFIDLFIKSINREDFSMRKLQNLILFKQNSYELNINEIKNFDLIDKNNINEVNNKIKRFYSLFLRNLLSDKNETNIINSFQKFLKYGIINSVKILNNNKYPTNYCFINFTNEKDCFNALENAKNDKEVQKLFSNKECYIDYQKEKKKIILEEEENKVQNDVQIDNLKCNKISNCILETAEKNNIKITKIIADNIVRKYDHDILNDTLKKIKYESYYQNFLEIVQKEKNRIKFKENK